MSILQARLLSSNLIEHHFLYFHCYQSHAMDQLANDDNCYKLFPNHPLFRSNKDQRIVDLREMIGRLPNFSYFSHGEFVSSNSFQNEEFVVACASPRDVMSQKKLKNEEFDLSQLGFTEITTEQNQEIVRWPRKELANPLTKEELTVPLQEIEEILNLHTHYRDTIMTNIKETHELIPHIQERNLQPESMRNYRDTLIMTNIKETHELIPHKQVRRNLRLESMRSTDLIPVQVILNIALERANEKQLSPKPQVSILKRNSPSNTGPAEQPGLPPRPPKVLDKKNILKQNRREIPPRQRHR